MIVMQLSLCELLLSSEKRFFKNSTDFKGPYILKSVRIHFAYGRIALMLELLGQFGRFWDENDRCNSPILLILLRGSLGSNSKVYCIAISKVWTTGMLVVGEGLPDKQARARTSSKDILTTGNAELRTTPPN